MMEHNDARASWATVLPEDRPEPVRTIAQESERALARAYVGATILLAVEGADAIEQVAEHLDALHLHTTDEDGLLVAEGILRANSLTLRRLRLLLGRGAPIRARVSARCERHGEPCLVYAGPRAADRFMASDHHDCDLEGAPCVDRQPVAWGVDRGNPHDPEWGMLEGMERRAMARPSYV